MRKYDTILLLLCMMFLLIAGGCNSREVETDFTESDVQEIQNQEEGVYITLYLPDNADKETDINAEIQNIKTLDDLTTTLVTIVPEEELNAEAIVSQYNQLVVVGLYGEEFVVNEVRQDGNQVWVDFDSAHVQAMPFEEGTEGILFYHLAKSIADNLGDVDSIYLTMDGGNDFKLGHLWFDATRPFYTGVMPTEGE